MGCGKTVRIKVENILNNPWDDFTHKLMEQLLEKRKQKLHIFMKKKALVMYVRRFIAFFISQINHVT